MNCKNPLTKLEKIKQQFCEYNWNVFYTDLKKKYLCIYFRFPNWETEGNKFMYQMSSKVNFKSDLLKFSFDMFLKCLLVYYYKVW